MTAQPMIIDTYRPDILAEGLQVVFCGVNPAASAAADGHNFSHPGNRFWSVIHLSGFTDVRLRPEDENHLLTFGCGITAAVSSPTRRADQVAANQFRYAQATFESKMRGYQPRVIAFLGKRALSAMTKVTDLPWGRQREDFAGAIAWVLPNPSGLNRNFTLEALVNAYSELRMAVDLPDRCASKIGILEHD